MINKIIGRNISILYRHEIVYIDMKLEEYHLNKIQAECILFLRESNIRTQTQTQLNSYFMFNKATITRIVKHLELYDYVKSTVNENDTREKYISITDKGIKTVPKLIEIFEEWESGITNNVNDQDIENLRNTLDQMVCNMKIIKEAKK